MIWGGGSPARGSSELKVVAMVEMFLVLIISRRKKEWTAKVVSVFIIQYLEFVRKDIDLKNNSLLSASTQKQGSLCTVFEYFGSERNREF